ncbi:hypothetical protein F9L16_23520 [Agarivorans sp. B2Z047]|uniref:hypothetical protein n=1 Tax=Agarivorans sp. B2Z047 TaxID=2652721 RepID=UPI00128D5333|nr:hypothetical protein [Agarivorans sp. B2Z047]MPW31927.1 hypothetical protein [Agarivorans sp. B2Z047]UQN41897.1 hypothetical protein LQZ07_19275 [Agarivorans sp. B2Z047]
MSAMRTVKALGSASPLGTMLSLGFKQITTKKRSDEVYRTLVPLLHEQIKLGKTVQDPMVAQAQEVLISLAPFGARRKNFKLWYSGSVDKLLKLPHDPDELSYGCWW